VSAAAEAPGRQGARAPCVCNQIQEVSATSPKRMDRPANAEIPLRQDTALDGKLHPPSHPIQARAYTLTSRPRIIAYYKSGCGWTPGVRAVLEKYGLECEYREVSRDPEQFAEMVRKTGQTAAPCVEIDGHMLADVGGAEVEAWLIRNAIVAGRTR
jgi:glutaredoxin